MRKEIHTQELKELELEILRYLDKICKENNITYYLCAGTLLGAVRHAGFIPWDDDIDVMLMRDDYECLIEILNNKAGRYRVMSSDTKDDYFYLFAKLVDTETCLDEHGILPISDYGVYVDLFPLDNLPDNETVRKKMQDKFFADRKCMGYAVMDFKPTTFSKRMAAFVIRKLGWKYFLKKMNKKLELLKQNVSSEYVAVIVSANKPYQQFKREWFDGCEYLEFEGETYPAPSNYDGFLTALYGDYMKLPPIEQQVTHHDFTAYYRYEE